MNELVCYTDGSALNNRKNAPAGWACYFPKYDLLASKGIYGTNNFAELTAISFALYYVLEELEIHNMKFIIKTDSEYCIKVLTNPKKIKENKEKIEHCRNMIEKLIKNNNVVEFIHVDAHTNGKDDDSIYNDKVDKKARERAIEMSKT